MKAELTANLEVLEEMYDDLVKLLGQVDAATVNWVPLASDTNSIAAMVIHTAGATDSWLSRAAGQELPRRNRDGEFAVQSTPDELIQVVEQSRQRIRALFESMENVDLGVTRTYQRMSKNETQERSMAWCIEHAVIHAGEHWGQIQLNRQLYDARAR